MLFGGYAGHGLEPVGIMGGAFFNGPLLHCLRNGVGNILFHFSAVFDNVDKPFVNVGREALSHDLPVKNHAAEDLRDICHTITPLSYKIYLIVTSAD